MRNNYSCPDCGFVYKDEDDLADHCKFKGGSKESIDCPRCGVHYEINDYYEEMYKKWGYAPSLPEEIEKEENNLEEIIKNNELAEKELDKDE